MNVYLQETLLLNYSHPRIVELIEERQWKGKSEREKILQIYNYVRDEISFGYNQTDHIPASIIMQDGYGQCNTKGILFMSLLRALDIPCRLHGFTIDKALQKGAMRSWYYKLAPQEIIHSWVEVWYNERWLNIEGFILDIRYLTKLQQKFERHTGSFCGYGAATNNLQDPAIHWQESDTYIQKEGIVQDFGIFNDPDSFFENYSQGLSAIKQIIYGRLVRHLMNRNVNRIRNR